MRRLLSFSLSLLLVFSIIPFASASADDETVAKIGDNSYTALFGANGAFASAVEGDTVTLVKDVKESGSATIDKAVTLDLAGFNAVFYGQSKVFTNTAAFTVKSSGQQSDLGYSGVLFTSSADLTVENVKTHEANAFPDFDSETDYLSDVNWIAGYYKLDEYRKIYEFIDNTDVDNPTYEDNMKVTIAEMLPVTAGDKFVFDYTNKDKKALSVEVYGFDTEGNFTKNLGVYNNTASCCTIPEGTTQVRLNLRGTNVYDYAWAKATLLPKVKNGTIVVKAYKVTEPCDFEGTNNFVEVQKDGIKLKLDTVGIDKTLGTTSVLNFDKAITFDVNELTFKTQNLGGKTAFTINNENSKGTFKDSTISGNNSHALTITKTSSDGITLDNCKVSTSGDGGKTSLIVNGGKVNLIGGSAGSNGATTGVSFYGGTITVDGTTFAGAKGDYALNINSSANVTIKKAVIVKSPKTINDQAIFLNSLAPETAIYNSDTKSPKTIVSRTEDLNSLDKIYVDACEHYCTNEQEGSTTCAYCLLNNATINHDYTVLEYDENSHWYVCSRCDENQTPEKHYSKGNNVATCTKKPVCDICEQEYGNPLGHSFTNYTVDSTEGCEHNVVKVAECDNGCGIKDYDYSQAEANIEVVQEAVDPTCTAKGYTKETKCSICGKTIQARTEIDALGHDWGDEVIDTEPTYVTVGSAHRDCKRCDAVDKYDLPVKKIPAKYAFAVTDADGDVTSEDQLFISFADAIDAIEAGGTILVMRDFATSETLATDKAFTLDLQGHSFTSSNTSGAIKTTADLNVISSSDDRAKVNFNKAFVVSSATFTMDNVNAEATTAGSVFNSSAATAKFVATNSVIGTNGISGLAFTTAFEFDISDSEIRGGATFENAGLFGVVKNTKFYRSNSSCAEVKKTSDEGVELQGCTCSQGAWDSTVFTVSGGKCKLTNGTVIDGSNIVSRVLNVTGGTVEINDANLKGDKGLDTGRRLIYYSGGTVKIYKAKFELGTNQSKYDGIISNDDATLRSFLAEGCCFFNSSDATDENAFEYTTENLIHKKVLYVDSCGDWDTTATCTTAGKCTYCNKDMDALGHNFQWNCDDTNHWKECTRCELVQEGTTEAHTAGAKATCTHGTTCEVCGLFYGEALGHNIAKDNDGNFIYGYDSNSHWKTCTRCDEHIDTQSHSGGTATCTEKAVCEFCGLEYGEPLGHSFVTYVSNNDATCTRDGTKTAVCAHGCGATDTIDDVGSMKAHNIVEDPAVAATCNSMGKTAGSHCADCGKVIVEQNWIAVNPNAHDWDSGVTTPATCKAKGKIVYTCANCGKTEEVELPIDPNAHVLSTTSKAATYFAAGYKNRKVCKLCGKVVSAGTKIAKKVLAKPTKSTVKAGKRQFTVKYKKVKGATGFQVRYRIKGKWIVKTFNTKKNASKVIKKLAKGKYTVQIRAMVKKGSKKAYSKWAKAKKVTVK